MEPTRHRIPAHGVELCVFEWGRAVPGAPTILLAHATGFHARCWDPMVRRLGDRHVVAVDQRGHGRSDKPEITHWNVFGRDLSAVVRALDLTDVVGAGHSMGGHAMTEAAAAAPDRFRRLVLVDPVITAPEDYRTDSVPRAASAEPHPTARRRYRFRSAAEMIERFRDRLPYARFHPDALRAYCEHGLLPAPDGEGFVLACPPATEASIYATSRTNGGVYDAVRALEMPVLVLRAKLPPVDRDPMDFSSSPTWPGLAGELRRGREIHLADRSHFLPMESPEWMAGVLTDADRS